MYYQFFFFWPKYNWPSQYFYCVSCRGRGDWEVFKRTSVAHVNVGLILNLARNFFLTNLHLCLFFTFCWEAGEVGVGYNLNRLLHISDAKKRAKKRTFLQVKGIVKMFYLKFKFMSIIITLIRGYWRGS